MSRSRWMPWINLLALIVALAMNGLANALPINGLNTGQISDRFQVYFVPAGYVFSIWGLIYLGLLAFGIYQALPAQSDNPRLKRIGYWFMLGCLANSVWILLWHYGFFLWTLAAMITLLISLIVIYLRLGIGRCAVPAVERWLVHTPFSIYLGWITVATVANVTDVLWYLGWGGWGIHPATWAVIMLLAATGIALLVNWTRADAAYVLVIVWAFVGIAVKQANVELVARAARALALVVALPLVVTVPRSRRRRIQGTW
jgi:benzodiazapine receptor